MSRLTDELEELELDELDELEDELLELGEVLDELLELGGFQTVIHSNSWAIMIPIQIQANLNLLDCMVLGTSCVL